MNCFTLHVDYTVPTYEDLKASYFGISGFHDGHRWMRPRSYRNVDVMPAQREFQLSAVPEQFSGKSIDTNLKELSEYFDKLGYRFAIDLELYAFGTTCHELKRKSYIIALGAQKFHAGWYVASLGVDSHRRRWLDAFWTGDYQFGSSHLLLVRK